MTTDWLDHRRIDLPLKEVPTEDEIARLSRELPECPR